MRVSPRRSTVGPLLGRIAAGLILILLTLSVCTRTSTAASDSSPARISASRLWEVQPLSVGWTYRIGGSPRLPNGDWLWAQPDFDDGNWQTQARTGAALTANGQRELWLRVRLPNAALLNPLLFLHLVGSEQAAYLNGKPAPLQAFSDHPWEQHLCHERYFYVRPSTQDAGSLLTVHIRSEGSLLGIFFPVLLGEESAVGFAVIRGALFPLVLAALTTIVFIATFVLFLVNRKDFALLYFSLMCLLTGIFLLAISGIPGILIGPGVPAIVLARFPATLVIFTLCGFSLEILDHKYLRWMKWAKILIAVFAAAQLISALYDIRITESLERPVGTLLLVTIVGIAVSAALSARAGDENSKILCTGLALTALCIVPQALTILGIAAIPMRIFLIRCSFGVFLSTLGWILIRRFMAVHRQLGTFSEMLGIQVQALERHNTEIQTLNDELRRQIEQRSDRMIDLLTRSRSWARAAPIQKIEIGQILCAHYRVVRALGEGAMGKVFEVERVSDGLHLAAKLLSGKSERTAMIRFIREARILAQLKHPNLVSIMDVDLTEEGSLFLVMELVSGMTLKDAKERCHDLKLAASVLRQLCLGLQAIHGQGIVHRDLKPANILLAETAAGVVVKIADFGISTLSAGESTAQSAGGPPSQTTPRKGAEPATAPAAPVTASLTDEDLDLPTTDLPAGWSHSAPFAIEPSLPVLGERSPPTAPPISDDEEGAHLTQTGALIGTPLYMAPELASGSRNAPPASDIFSFGVIAFELLTGRLPFTVPSVVAVWSNQAVAAPPLQTQRSDLPGALAAVLDRCLAADPASRPTLQELLSAIPT